MNKKAGLQQGTWGKDTLTRLGSWLYLNVRIADPVYLWPVALAVGIGIYFSLSFEPHPMAVFSGFLLSIAVVLVGLSKSFSFKTAAFLVAFVFLGAVVAMVRTFMMAAPILPDEDMFLDVTGTIYLAEPMGAGDVRLVLEDIVLSDIPRNQTPKRIRITVRTEDPITVPGARVSMRAILNPPGAPVWPGGYDFARAAWFDQIGAFGVAVSPVISAGQAIPAPSGITLVRQSIAERINGVLEPPAAGIATALVTGFRAGIGEKENDVMRVAGLAHLLAISGLHMALITGFVFFAVRALLAAVPRIALLYPIKEISAVVALVAAFLYLFISGAGVSASRAFIMVSIVLLAIIVGRRPISMRLVAIAAFLILLLQPEALLGAGFHMSFAAVIGLIAGYEYLAPLLRRLRRDGGWQGRILLYVMGIVISTLIAEVTIGPIAAFHFGRFTAYGLLGNLLAVPLAGFVVMPMLLVSVLLMPFDLDAWALKVAGFGIEQVLAIAEWVSALPGAEVLVPKVPDSVLLLYAAGFLMLVLMVGKIRLLGFAPLAMALVVSFSAKAPNILVNEEGDLIAVKTESGWVINSYVRARYTRDVWAKSLGIEGFGRFPDMGERLSLGGEGTIACDEAGCLLNRGSVSIAFPERDAAVMEDCARADYIFTNRRVPRSCKAIAYDRFDLRESGSVALRFDNGDVDIKTVAGERGVRPWSAADRF